jgi:hypothetical protein
MTSIRKPTTNKWELVYTTIRRELPTEFNQLVKAGFDGFSGERQPLA